MTRGLFPTFSNTTRSNFAISNSSRQTLKNPLFGALCKVTNFYPCFSFQNSTNTNKMFFDIFVFAFEKKFEESVLKFFRSCLVNRSDFQCRFLSFRKYQLYFSSHVEKEPLCPFGVEFAFYSKSLHHFSQSHRQVSQFFAFSRGSDALLTSIFL